MTQAQKATGSGLAGLTAVYAGLLVLLYAAYAFAFFVVPTLFGGIAIGGEFFLILPFFAAMQTGAVATRRWRARPQGRNIWRLSATCALVATLVFAISLGLFLALLFYDEPKIPPTAGDIAVLSGLSVLLTVFFLLMNLAGLWFGGRAAARRLARNQPPADQGDLR